MNTSSSSSICTNGHARFDASEVRRIVELGKSRGLIRAAGEAAAVDKNGLPAAALGAIRSQWIDVTPELARRWLENNFVNRRLDDGVVAAYARDMRNGVWVPTHQGVAFNDRDELIDGQHRLRAIVLTGLTIRMMVTFGLPSVIAGKEMTTMDAVDRGRTRSVADQLKIQHGLKHGSAIAMICNSLAQLCCGERSRRVSVGQTLEIYRLYEPCVVWTIARRAKTAGLRQAGALAGFTMALATETDHAPGEGPVARAFEALMTGQGLRDRSPIARLHAFLLSDEAKLITHRLNRGVAELTLQAIWLELQGRPIATLEMGMEGADHFRALQQARVEKIAGMFRLPKG